jgi:thiol-disulfide isomerase/thioredoxin
MRSRTIPVIVLLALLMWALAPAGAQTKNAPKKPAAGPAKGADTKNTDVKKPSADYGKYDFTLTTLDGKTVKLSDYAGKVVLVNLWAPWCGPCKVEMPGFVRLHEKYKDRGFDIISVAVQTSESAVRSFIEKTPLDWAVGLNEDVAVKYGTYGLPDNYLFLPDGMMTRHFIGFTKEEALEPLIQAGIERIKPQK